MHSAPIWAHFCCVHVYSIFFSVNMRELHPNENAKCCTHPFSMHSVFAMAVWIENDDWRMKMHLRLEWRWKSNKLHYINHMWIVCLQLRFFALFCSRFPSPNLSPHLLGFICHLSNDHNQFDRQLRIDLCLHFKNFQRKSFFCHAVITFNQHIDAHMLIF